MTSASKRPYRQMIEVYGERKSIAEWARDPRCVVAYATLYNRIVRAGWSPETALRMDSRGHDMQGLDDEARRRLLSEAAATARRDNADTWDELSEEQQRRLVGEELLRRAVFETKDA